MTILEESLLVIVVGVIPLLVALAYIGYKQIKTNKTRKPYDRYPDIYLTPEQQQKINDGLVGEISWHDLTTEQRKEIRDFSLRNIRCSPELRLREAEEIDSGLWWEKQTPEERLGWSKCQGEPVEYWGRREFREFKRLETDVEDAQRQVKKAQRNLDELDDARRQMKEAQHKLDEAEKRRKRWLDEMFRRTGRE